MNSVVTTKGCGLMEIFAGAEAPSKYEHFNEHSQRLYDKFDKNGAVWG
jgi:hypothetical protein